MKMSHKDKVEWRRDQVQQLLAKGHHSHREISSILQTPKSTISRDILYLNQNAKDSIRKYIDQNLPEEKYEKCLVGLTAILREAWTTSHRTDIDTKEKIQALSLAKECYSMKLDLLTNATVVDDAMRFVSNYNHNHTKQDTAKIEASASSISTQEKEEKTTATTTSTTNQVF